MEMEDKKQTLKKRSPVYFIALFLVALIPVLVLNFTLLGQNSDTMKFVKSIAGQENSGTFNPALYGGVLKDKDSTSAIQKFLTEDYSLADASALQEEIDWLMNSGYRGTFQSMYEAYLGQTEDWLSFSAQLEEENPEELAMFNAAFEEYQASGETRGLLAFDYSEAVNLAGWGYVAGYLTFEESAQISVDACAKIQQEFQSWEDYEKCFTFDSMYLYSNTVSEMETERAYTQDRFEELRSSKGKLYDIPFNTPLKLSEMRTADIKFSGDHQDMGTRLGVSLAVLAFCVLITFGILYPILYAIMGKVLAKKVETDTFQPNYTFHSSTAKLWIDVAGGKLAVLTRGNPFRLQYLSAENVDRAYTDSHNTSNIKFIVVINGVKLKIPTFVSNRFYSRTHEKVVTGINKADTYVEALLAAKENVAKSPGYTVPEL